MRWSTGGSRQEADVDDVDDADHTDHAGNDDDSDDYNDDKLPRQPVVQQPQYSGISLTLQGQKVCVIIITL